MLQTVRSDDDLAGSFVLVIATMLSIAVHIAGGIMTCSDSLSRIKALLLGRLAVQAGYYLTCFEGALMHITDTDHGISAAREDAAEAAGMFALHCFLPLSVGL